MIFLRYSRNFRQLQSRLNCNGRKFYDVAVYLLIYCLLLRFFFSFSMILGIYYFYYVAYYRLIIRNNSRKAFTEVWFRLKGSVPYFPASVKLLCTVCPGLFCSFVCLVLLTNIILFFAQRFMIRIK